MAAAITLAFILAAGISRYFFVVCSTPFLADKLFFPTDSTLIFMCFLPAVFVAPMNLLDTSFKVRRIISIVGVGLIGLLMWLVPYLITQGRIPDPSSTAYTTSLVLTTLLSWTLAGTAAVYVAEFVRERLPARKR